MTKTTLTNDDFKKLVSQANLILSDEEVEMIKSQLDEALMAVQVLNELDTTGVPTLNHPTGDMHNIMREDKVEDSLTQDLALSGARTSHNGYFTVKAVFDETT